ncbi:hypothetical protein L9F63_019137, partial [Diploptera punctata]
TSYMTPRESLLGNFSILIRSHPLPFIAFSSFGLPYTVASHGVVMFYMVVINFLKSFEHKVIEIRPLVITLVNMTLAALVHDFYVTFLSCIFLHSFTHESSSLA